MIRIAVCCGLAVASASTYPAAARLVEHVDDSGVHDVLEQSDVLVAHAIRLDHPVDVLRGHAERRQRHLERRPDHRTHLFVGRWFVAAGGERVLQRSSDAERRVGDRAVEVEEHVRSARRASARATWAETVTRKIRPSSARAVEGRIVPPLTDGGCCRKWPTVSADCVSRSRSTDLAQPSVQPIAFNCRSRSVSGCTPGGAPSRTRRRSRRARSPRSRVPGPAWRVRPRHRSSGRRAPLPWR